MKTERVRPVLKQDFHAFKLAIDNGNFERANIFANRFMSNAMFCDNSLHMLPGYLMKEIALHLQAVQRREGPVSTAKGIALDFMKKVQGGIESKDLDISSMWSNYVVYFDKMRAHLMDNEEKKAYKTDTDFVDEIMTWAVSFLSDRRELLLSLSSFLIKGVLNEIDRVYRVHGGNVVALTERSLIASLDRVYDYYRQAHADDEESFRARIQDEVFPVVDKIRDIYLPQPVKHTVPQATELLCNLAIRWRELFVEYMEAPRLVGAMQPMIQVPPEAKEKVKKAIVEGLERELKKT